MFSIYLVLGNSQCLFSFLPVLYRMLYDLSSLLSPSCASDLVYLYLTKLMLFSVFQVVLYLHLKESMAAFVGRGNQWREFLDSSKVITV